jgi:hypothetical protein
MTVQPSPSAQPALPANPPPSGTIDITNLVEQLRQAFVRWGTQFIINAAAAVPYLSWLGLPVIRQLFQFIVNKLLDVLSKAMEMQGFFMNTAIRKASQAKDFVDAVAAKEALPPTASNEEYENAEKRQMVAFRNFVMFTN